MSTEPHHEKLDARTYGGKLHYSGRPVRRDTIAIAAT